MLKILALDPSGTGTTGICLVGEKITFQEFSHKKWMKHLEFIKQLIEQEKPNLLLYENTYYLHSRPYQGSVSLFKLLGALEGLPIRVEESILVHQVKELRKQLFKGTKTIPNLEFKLGKGWFFANKKISVHELDAFLVYWLWKEGKYE